MPRRAVDVRGIRKDDLAPMRWPTPPKPGEVNHGSVDRFTLVHAAVGAVYALLGLGPISMLVLAVAWELVENPLKAGLPRLFPHATADTLRNAVGDVLATILAYVVVRALWAR